MKKSNSKNEAMCGGCRYFKFFPSDTPQHGKCRRYAPRPIVATEYDGFTAEKHGVPIIPVRECCDWCGEFEAHQSKEVS